MKTATQPTVPASCSPPEAGTGLFSTAIGAAFLLMIVLTFAQFGLIMRDRTVAAAASSRAAAELAAGRPSQEVEFGLRETLGANTSVDVSATASDITVRVRRRTQKIVPSAFFDRYLVSDLTSTERREQLVS